MIAVRFPSGFSVQYNDADTVQPAGEGYHDVIRKQPRKWYARVGPDCILEGSSPCRTYQAATEQQNRDLVAQIEALRKEVRTLTRKVAKTEAAKGTSK